MQDDIGLVIAKGLSVVYKERPDNAVDFFGKWLLQQSDIRKAEQFEKKMEAQVQQLKEKEEYEVKARQKAAAELEEQKKEQ